MSIKSNLLKSTVFKIIPILNPYEMILGSFRTKNATMGQIVTLGVTAIVLLMLWGNSQSDAEYHLPAASVRKDKDDSLW